MRFESPLFLLLLFFVPLLLQRKQNALKYAGRVALGALTELGAAISWRVRYGGTILTSFRVAAFVFAVIALARPQTGGKLREVESGGRDILLALDLSGSMQALDFFVDGQRVDRLTALKKVVGEFVLRREGDRMGIIVFGDEVFTQSPLTKDVTTLAAFIERLAIGMAGQGTAVGDAIAISLKRMKDIPAPSKVIVLVTDGKSNAGSLSPVEAARAAKQMGVKVYTVGIGSNAPAPFPARTPFGGTTLVNRPMDFDEPTLRAIAEETNGRYFNAKDTDTLEQVYNEIDTLEERIDQSYEFVEFEEEFRSFLLLALLCFFACETLAGTLLLRVP